MPWHTATAYPHGDCDTGALSNGEAKTVTFTEPGIYYDICTPHPWMFEHIIVD